MNIFSRKWKFPAMVLARLKSHTDRSYDGAYSLFLKSDAHLYHKLSLMTSKIKIKGSVS